MNILASCDMVTTVFSFKAPQGSMDAFSERARAITAAEIIQRFSVKVVLTNTIQILVNAVGLGHKKLSEAPKPT
jgi:hypothetical protein